MEQSKEWKPEWIIWGDDIKEIVVPYWLTQDKLIPGIHYPKPQTESKKYCFATKTSNQSIPNTTGTTITLDSYETNDTAMSTTANRITITKPGQYLVSAIAQFAINSTGSRDAWLRVNWGTTFAEVILLPNPSDLTSVSLNTMKTFAVNDYVEMRVYQNSWGNLNVNSGIANTFLSVHQL